LTSVRGETGSNRCQSMVHWTGAWPGFADPVGLICCSLRGKGCIQPWNAGVVPRPQPAWKLHEVNNQLATALQLLSHQRRSTVLCWMAPSWAQGSEAICVYLQGLLANVLLKGVVRTILSNVPGSQEYDCISSIEIEILRLAQSEPTKAYLPSSIAPAAHSEPVQSTEWSGLSYPVSKRTVPSAPLL
jgi:hypothetical protein